MPIFSVLIAAVAFAQAADTWTLKAPAAADTKLTWDCNVDADAEGQKHHATFQMSRTLNVKDPKKLIATFRWDKLSVDDQDGQDVPAWDVIIGAKGEILKAVEPLDDDYRRMLSGLVFVYPEKPIAIGDKWSEEIQPTGTGAKITYAYEAKQVDTVKDEKALLVSAKITEEGKDHVTGEGSWWISRAGRVLKFEVKLKNWVVPMAGAQAFDATVTGKAAI